MIKADLIEKQVFEQRSEVSKEMDCGYLGKSVQAEGRVSAKALRTLLD